MESKLKFSTFLSLLFECLFLKFTAEHLKLHSILPNSKWKSRPHSYLQKWGKILERYDKNATNPQMKAKERANKVSVTKPADITTGELAIPSDDIAHL